MSYSEITPVTPADYPAITEVWEASVRATHHFLKEEDILFFKPRIAEYLKQVDAFCIKNKENNICGFVGVADKNIEMLFIHPSERGKGLGKRFLGYAMNELSADKVDVNEQNEQALRFYEKMGFKVESRDELDGNGLPYPILHMKLRGSFPAITPSTPPVEEHPLGFFLPENTRLLMLGSFPPPKQRWSMEFYYPNIINDMWRIMGIVFYNDKDYFLKSRKAFSKEKAEAFCLEKGIGLGDTAVEIIRLKANASDKFLEVVTPIDLPEILQQIPLCEAIVVTGQKAMDTLLSVMPQAEEPAVGSYSECTFAQRPLKIFRMPSSSRAYPKPLDEKAEIYRGMFKTLQML